MIQPQIVEKPALTVVGLEAPFLHGLSSESTAAEVIPHLWERFSSKADQVPGRTGHQMLGVIYGRPETERSHPDELQYIAGVAVSSANEIPPGMVSRTIPAGKFAVFIHRGPIHKLAVTVREIYRVWLPQSDYKHAEIADIELYDQRFDCESDDSEMEYWISIAPKNSARP
jgi:AraC family transcriptional regulator